MFNSRFTNIRIRKNNNNNNLKKLQAMRPNKLLSNHHRMVKNYIKGLLHPELAVTTGFIPKAPNYVSIPTSNITFREAFDIVPDANGEFILYWTPNFLATDDTIKKLTVFSQLPEEYKDKLEYSRNWLGGFDDQCNIFCYTPIAAYKPPASFTKYRLVSAGCKITYKGATINRAGIISHCLSYRSFPVTYFVKDTKNIISAAALEVSEHYGQSINEIATTSIQNGMWNNVVNVQKNQTSYAVAIPTDPSDFIFEDDGLFYKAAGSDDRIWMYDTTWVDGNEVEQHFVGAPQLPQDGTPCTYIFKGTDLTSDAKLYVEQFYNFEVIPTEDSAPVLRPRMQNLSSDELEKSKSIANKILNGVKGAVNEVSDYAIDTLLNETWPNIVDIRNNIPVYRRPIVQQQPKKQKRSQSFANKAKNFGKTVLNESKNVLKDVSNVLFTKENAFKLGSTIADMLVNKIK